MPISNPLSRFIQFLAGQGRLWTTFGGDCRGPIDSKPARRLIPACSPCRSSPRDRPALHPRTGPAHHPPAGGHTRSANGCKAASGAVGQRRQPRILITAHVPDPFELTLSTSATGSAELTGLVATQTMIDSSRSFTNQDHTVWCVGSESFCSPPYNGSGYYGFRFTLADAPHYGWVSTFFLNQGFGSLDLRITAAAYDNRPDWPIPVGAVDPILPTCESVDFNCDGDVGTDADIEVFFACIAGACPPPPCQNTSDFNNDGDLGTDADIEAFFSVLAGNPCPLAVSGQGSIRRASRFRIVSTSDRGPI